MLGALFMVTMVLVADAAQHDSQCSPRRSSSLQFNVRSEVNGTGQRIVKVDLQNAAHNTDVVRVSLDHWTTTCVDTEMVAFTLSLNVPSSGAVPPPPVNTFTPSTTPHALSCPPGYEELPNVGCFKDMKKEMTRQEALENCRSEGARLAVPRSRTELAFFGNMYRRSGPSLWLGIKKIDGKWKTDEGSTDFFGWNTENITKGGDCVRMLESRLETEACGVSRRSICEIREM